MSSRKTQEGIRNQIPTRDKKAGTTILIEARIFAAMIQLEKPERAAQARARLKNTISKLGAEDLEKLTKWKYHRPREGEIVSQAVNQTAQEALSQR